MEHNDKELMLSVLRETLKYHRDILTKVDDEELLALGRVLDAFILVSYNPEHLKDLTLLLTVFLNSKLGGEN